MTVPNQAAAPASVATPAAPAAPLSVDERISAKARGFLADLDANDDPDQIEPLAPPQQQQEANPEVQETPEGEEPEAETPTPEQDPMVEFELDGKKATIPEWVKHRVMADKDYRQKTMEVAATRKQLEALTANAANVMQQAQQMAPYHAQLFQMDNQAQYLHQRLSSGELNEDPLAYNRVQGELALLLRNRDAFANGLHQRVNQLNAEQHKLRVEQLRLEAPKLLEEFPEIAKPETQQKLAQYIADAGLPEEAIAFINYSAPGARLAWKAHQYDVMVADQKKAQAKLKETVKTLPGVTQSSRAADAGAKDKQLREGWVKRGGNINDPAFSQYLRSKIRR